MVLFEFTNQFVITFLFVFAIVFGVLQIKPIWGKPINAVIALAISLFAVMYSPFQATLWSYLPNVTWFFIIMFFIAFVMEIMGFRKQKPGSLEGLIIQTGVLLVMMSLGFMLIDMMTIDIPLIGSMSNLLFVIGILLIISLFMGVMKLQIAAPQKEKKE